MVRAHKVRMTMFCAFTTRIGYRLTRMVF